MFTKNGVHSPLFLTDEERTRQRLFDDVVGEYSALLADPNVEAGLGSDVHGAHQMVAEMLVPAVIKHGVISMDRRHRAAGKIPLALLSNKEAKGYQVAPNISGCFHPMQLETQVENKVDLKFLRCIRMALPLVRYVCAVGGEMLDPDHHSNNGFLHDSLDKAAMGALVGVPDLMPLEEGGEIGSWTWPLILLKKHATKNPTAGALRLGHEVQHAVQSLFEKRHFATEDQGNDPNLMSYIHEVEAYSVGNIFATASTVLQTGKIEIDEFVLPGLKYQLQGRSHTDQPHLTRATEHQVKTLMDATEGFYKDQCDDSQEATISRDALTAMAKAATKRFIVGPRAEATRIARVAKALL